MKSVTVTVPHDLGRAGAKARVQAGFGQMKERFAAMGVQEMTDEWDGDVLSFSARGMGQKIGGRMSMGDKDVRIELDVPALLAAMSDRIAGGIKQQVGTMLEHKTV